MNEQQITRSWTPPGPVGKAFVESGAEVCIEVGPVGSAKTSNAVHKLLLLAALQRPSADGVRYTRFIVVRSTQQRLLSSTLPSFEEWVPELIGDTRKTSPIERRIKTADMSIEFHFLGIDDLESVSRVMGMNASAILIDEGREIDNLRPVLGQLLTRAGRFPPMRDGGPSFPTRALIISNASDKAHDLYKLAVSERPENCEAFIAPPALLSDLRTVNPEAENVRNLPAGFYITLARTLPPDRLAVEVMNEWGLMSEGKPLVPEFRSSTHVSPHRLEPRRGQPLLVGLDPGNHPAAEIGSRLETESGEVRWEIYAELIGSNVVSSRFAATLRDFVERRFPDNPVQTVFIDPVGFHPSDRDDEKLIADLYAAITGWAVRAPSSRLVDVLLESTRLPFGALVGGAPAILLDASCTTLAAALAGKVCYREAVSGMEKVTTDMVIKRHPWIDAYSALSYLLSGGGGFRGMRELVKAAKRTNHGARWREGLVWSHRIGKWVDPATGKPVEKRGGRIAEGVEENMFGEGGDRDARR